MMLDAPFHAELAEGPAGARAYWQKTEDDLRIRARADWAMDLLLDYAEALAPLHARHRNPPTEWMNGM